jgi:sterol 3beta-glucosyltransferase
VLKCVYLSYFRCGWVLFLGSLDGLYTTRRSCHVPERWTTTSLHWVRVVGHLLTPLLILISPRFGSVMVENPAELTHIIFEATRLAGVRAVVSPGWGGLASPDHHQIPPHVFILPNIPHDWLFSRVSAVCHHGGAGTTAIGLRLGKPTIVVPFFGDQPFWGRMVQLSGAGPYPIKPSKMSVEKLKAAIEFCMNDGAKKSAEALGEKMRKSVSGSCRVREKLNPLAEWRPARSELFLSTSSCSKHEVHVDHTCLSSPAYPSTPRCDLLPERLAVWWSTKHVSVKAVI